MIYLDTAATSLIKPPQVYEWAERAMRTCANPGRSGHRPALEAGRMVYETREKAAAFFGVSDPDRVIFTSNATDSLNLAIQGMVRPGGHVIVTSMEHNSVLRPVQTLADAGEIRMKVVWGDPVGGRVTVEDIEAALRPETCLVVCTHASNVTGTRMPAERIAGLCREKGVPFLLDASQTAGAYPIDMEKWGVDLLACPGHKGLLGLPGTGLLCLGPGVRPALLKQGGTGSFSEELRQPELLPDRYESGTLNTVGIASLGAGLDWLTEYGVDRLRLREEQLCARLLAGLNEIPGVRVYGPGDAAQRAAVVLFNIAGLDCSEVSFRLDREYGICTRSGLHCAPLAHQTVRSFPVGGVRMSMGPFTTEEEIDAALTAISALAAGTSAI